MAVHKYRVRDGFTYGALDQFKAGTIIELDDSVAVYNLDKLELVEVIPPPPPTLVAPDEPITNEIRVEQLAPKPKRKTSTSKK